MSNKIKELPENIRSECCLARVTIHCHELVDYDEGPYNEYEAGCDECGRDLEWDDDLSKGTGDGDVRECYNLSLRKDVDKIAKEMQELRKENKVSGRIVGTLKALHKELITIKE